MMKKKLLTVLFVIVLCLGAVLPVFAADTDVKLRVIDMAELLTESETAALMAKLDEISSRQKNDVVVVTTNDLQGYSVNEYADMLYESFQFGYGGSKDGVLLLISMEDHDWCISTCGYGITAFTDDGIAYIGKQISSDLSGGNYAAAFTSFAELCDDFITQAKTGVPYTNSNLPREPLSLIWIPIAILIGFIIAKIAVGSMKSKLKTVRAQETANSYVKENSMIITDSRDLFLYHTVTRSEKSKNSSDSSTHTSSSGTTHGGGSGKF